MAKVFLKGCIVFGVAEREAARQELQAHIRATRAEPGCLKFEVHETPGQAGRFDVEEVFVDREAFEKHQERVRDSKWWQVSMNAERHYSIDDSAS